MFRSLVAVFVVNALVVPVAAVGASDVTSSRAPLLDRLTTEVVEPGVLRVLHDGFRDLSGAASAAPPESYAAYLSTHVARDITTGRDGSVWIFEPDGFFELGGELVHAWTHQPGLRSWGNDVDVTSEGKLWRVAPGRTLRSFDGEHWTRYRQKQVVWALDIEPDGTVWATWVPTGVCAEPEGCVPRMLGRRDRKGWTIIEMPKLYQYSGHAFAVTGEGEAWLCCKRNPWKREPGFLRFDGRRWHVERSPFDGPGELSILLDASDDGTFWTRRSAQALERNRDGEWTLFTEADGVPPLGYVGGREFLVASSDGSVWVTTAVADGSDDAQLRCDGVAHFDGTTWTRYLRDTCVFSMDVAPDGTLWLQGAKVDIENIDLYTLGETVEPVQTFTIRPILPIPNSA